MARMQVFGLGLVLVLSWAGWASSATVDPRKTIGPWYHIFTASNELEKLSVDDHLRLYMPEFGCLGRKCDIILPAFVYRYEGYCIFLSTVMVKQHGGLYQTIVPPGNNLELLNVDNSMLLLGYEHRSSSGNTYAILALGREHTLSEADMEKFQKFLQEKGIGNQTVHFTNDSKFVPDICKDNHERRAPFTY